jgi:hypothetical protein
VGPAGIGRTVQFNGGNGLRDFWSYCVLKGYVSPSSAIYDGAQWRVDEGIGWKAAMRFLI